MFLPNTKVLLAETGSSQSASIRGLLDMQEMTVLTCGDGIETVKRAYSDNPDIIILETGISRLDGFHVARILKNDPFLQKIPLIVVGTKTEPADRFWANASGADFYLDRPVDAEELAEAFKEIFVKRAIRGDRLKPASITPLLDDTAVLAMAAGILEKNHFKAVVINELHAMGQGAASGPELFKGVMGLLSSLYNFSVGAVLVSCPAEGDIYYYKNQTLDETRLKQIRANILRSLQGRGHIYPAHAELLDIEFDADDLSSELVRDCNLHVHKGQAATRAVLALDNLDIESLDEDGRATLDSILDGAALVMDTYYTHETIKRLSIIDTVTDSSARGLFLRSLGREMTRARAAGLGLTAFTIAVSNKIPKEKEAALSYVLTHTIMGSISKSNIVARTGPAEFAFIMSGSPYDKVLTYQKGIANLLSSRAEAVVGAPVEISIGNASYDGSMKLTPESLLDEAAPKGLSELAAISPAEDGPVEEIVAQEAPAEEIQPEEVQPDGPPVEAPVEPENSSEPKDEAGDELDLGETAEEEGEEGLSEDWLGEENNDSDDDSDIGDDILSGLEELLEGDDTNEDEKE